MAAASTNKHSPAKPVYNFQSGLYALVTEPFELRLSPPSIEVVVLGIDHMSEFGLVEAARVEGALDGAGESRSGSIPVDI